MKKPFHLAWFLSQGYGPKSWRSEFPGSDIDRWMMPDLFVDLAQGHGPGLLRLHDHRGFLERALHLPGLARHLPASTPPARPSSIRPCWCPISRRRPRRSGIVPTLSVVGISALPAGAAGQLARPHDRGPHRLELRDRQQRRRGAELRPRQAPAARRALRRGRRVRRRRDEALGGVGARRRRARSREADVRRRQRRSIRSITRASTSRCADRSTRRARRRAGCRSARPAARRAARQFASRWADTIITEGGGSIDSDEGLSRQGPHAGRGVRPQSRRHQGAVPRPSDRRRQHGGGARPRDGWRRPRPRSISTCSSRACRG